MLIAIAVVSASCSAQSLGEAARKARKNKPAQSPAQKVYTNENMPVGASLSMVSGAGVDTPGVEGKKSSDATSNAGGGKAGASSADSNKDQDAWRAKFAEQKDKIQLLERELGVLQRENQMRAAVFYSDAGSRLRDEKRYAEGDRRYKADIETKQRDLASAKQRLEDMREEARKAGLPASVGD